MGTGLKADIAKALTFQISWKQRLSERHCLYILLSPFWGGSSNGEHNLHFRVGANIRLRRDDELKSACIWRTMRPCGVRSSFLTVKKARISDIHISRSQLTSSPARRGDALWIWINSSCPRTSWGLYCIQDVVSDTRAELNLLLNSGESNG